MNRGITAWNKVECGPNRLCVPDVGRIVWLREVNGNISLGRREAGWGVNWGWIVLDGLCNVGGRTGVTHWAYPVKPGPPEIAYDSYSGLDECAGWEIARG